MVEFTLRRILTHGTLENQLVTAVIVFGTLLMMLAFLYDHPNDPVIQFLLIAHATAGAILLAGMWHQHLR